MAYLKTAFLQYTSRWYVSVWVKQKNGKDFQQIAWFNQWVLASKAWKGFQIPDGTL